MAAANKSLLAATLVIAGILVLGIGYLLLLALNAPGPLDEFRLPDGSIDQMALGKNVYMKNCLACHMAEGQGGPNNVPPLVGSEWLIEDKETPIRILLGGLVGPITVKGQLYEGGIMARWSHLGDERIAAVLTYTRKSWGNDAEPIGAEEVAALRGSIPPRPWTAERLIEARRND